MDSVERARALLGVRFRPQGRNPVHGLDCVGLALCAFAVEPAQVRSDYRLRGEYRAEVEAFLRDAFRKVAPSRRLPGDLLLLRAGRDQLHLAILTADGFIHADAGIGRVVETPGRAPWPVLATFRPRQRRRRTRKG